MIEEIKIKHNIYTFKNRIMRNKSAQHILIRIRTIINILTWYTLHTLKRRRILRISFEIFKITLLNSVALLNKITRMRLNVLIVTKHKNIDIQ